MFNLYVKLRLKIVPSNTSTSGVWVFLSVLHVPFSVALFKLWHIGECVMVLQVMLNIFF